MTSSPDPLEPHPLEAGLSGESRGAARGETRVEALTAADRYDRMTRLAELFDRTGAELRERSRLGGEILADDDVAESAPLSPRTWETAEEDVRRATTGQRGLTATATELDADALVVRATVLTYRWIDDLAETATRTLGSIAGRAIGYLAPEVELGGAVVAAGLIEPEAADRDSIAAYLSELAESHPDLMEHLSSAGGLLEGLALRALLTPGLGAADDGPADGDGGAHGRGGAAAAGLRAAGVAPFVADAVGAVRDVAADFVDAGAAGEEPAGAVDRDAPRGLEGLMTALAAASADVEVHKAGPGRFIAYLPGRSAEGRDRLRLVGGDHATYVDQATRVVEAAVAGTEDARVLVAGGGRGGMAAAALAARDDLGAFTVEVAVTVGSPSSQAPRVGSGVRVLSLEDSADPVALLGSLINAGDEQRTSVVFDGGGAVGSAAWVAGGRVADESGHEGLREEIGRLRELGYLS